MRVPPAEEIVIADVHPSRIADIPVYDHNLSMIPVIELGTEPEQREFRIGELDNFDSGLLHFVVIPRSDLYIGYVLIYEPYLNTFARLLHQEFAYPAAAVILLEIEIFHMDMVPGVEDVVHEGIEFPPPGGYDLYPVVLAHCRAVAVGEQTGQLPVALTYLFLRILAEKERLRPRIGVPVESFEKPAVLLQIIGRVAHIEAEDNIKHYSDSRQKRNYKDPRYFLSGIAVAAQDDEYSPAYQQEQQYRPDG